MVEEADNSKRDLLMAMIADNIKTDLSMVEAADHLKRDLLTVAKAYIHLLRSM